MKKILLLVVVVCCVSICYSQIRRDALWCFGDSAGINFNTISPITFTSAVKGRGSCASIADSSGSLLFYAYTVANTGGNTTRVINNQDQLMQNGNNIVGEGWYNELVIVPNPGNNNQFYLFSIGVTGSSQLGLYYSIIDMSFNGGLGMVTQKNQLVINDTMTDCLAAIKHGNGRDWWLLCRRWDGVGLTPNNMFYKILISPNGITNYTQFIGSNQITGLGNIAFSSDGKRLVFTNYPGLIELYNFNRCNGNLSNPFNIQQEGMVNGKYPRYVGSAFSPNDSNLYVSSNEDTSHVYQYDLYSATPKLSDTVATLTYPAQTGGLIRLAPNNKIYWSCLWFDNSSFPYSDTTYNQYNMNLSVINYPDSIGAACNFQPFSFNLGGNRTYWGLPNNPNYDLGQLPNSPCAVGEEEIKGNEESLSIYPNPCTNICTISLNHFTNSTLFLYDVTGKLQLQQQLSNTTTHQLNISTLSSGIYIAEVQDAKGFAVRKKLVKE